MKDFGLTVYVNGTEKRDLDNALKRFKRRIEKSRVLEIYKRKQFYVKPSVAKKIDKK